MSKIARVKFIRDKEPNIKALTAKNKVLDGALYVATDTGTLWMGISSSSLIQIKDNINTNTTYNLTKSGSTITLRGSDGSTFNVTDSNTVYGNATASAAGLMSAADKAKLDGVAASSNHVTVDAELSTTSTNPVQNKVIKSALDGKSNTGHKHVKADITDFPTSMPASDVSAWAKQSSKPSYTISEVSGNLPASRISGTIAAANLPSYVDDVLEYASISKFPTTGESGKIYTALDTNKIYRWSGSAYIVISETIALGTTHSSAGYGDESRAAYNHSTKTSGNPHHVTKADVGLGSVDNTADSAKSVKYATSAGSVAWSNVSGKPSSMPASDVYSWAKQPSKPSYTASEVGAAPASHSHSYLPLSGGTMSGRILRGAGGSWISARNNAIAFGTTANSGSYNPVVGQKTPKGAWTIGNLASDERLVFSYDTDTDFNAGKNSSNATYLPVGGNSQEIITSATIGSQSVSHANTAGSVAWSNVSGKPSSMPASDVYSWAKQPSKPSYTASEVGAAPASHSHSYLPLSGGTMSGRILRGAGGSWISARNNAIAFGTTANSGSYNPVVGQKTPKGAWTIGNLASDERLVFSYDTDTDFNAGKNSSNATYLPVGGNSQEIITSATIGSQSVSHANTAGSVAWSNVTGRPTIPSVGNGTVTITQNGTNKGSFTLNQSGNATIALTDTNTNTWRPEEVIVSSSQPNASTCKLWIKV